MVSYLIENMIDYLIGNSVEAKILRENFIFFIVPMLNIDGVINGNYRCNLAGVDLNRQYINPTKQQHPTIYNLKTVPLIIQAHQADQGGEEPVVLLRLARALPEEEHLHV